MGSLAMSMFGADFLASGSAGPRIFECIPSPVNDNGRREANMPGTEHRHRWRYNEAGDGKTGSCCGLASCSSCEEKFAIHKANEQCGIGQSWVCASQHR